MSSSRLAWCGSESDWGLAQYLVESIHKVIDLSDRAKTARRQAIVVLRRQGAKEGKGTIVS